MCRAHTRCPWKRIWKCTSRADGYIGVNRIGDGEVNVCGLFRVRAEGRRPESKQDWLRGEPGSLLRERLRAAEFDPDSFCSVAGLQLQPQRAAGRAECCIGDALTMTPPVTGNGMSMAFESAELAMEPLADYSQGRLDWPAARRRLAQRCDCGLCAPAGVGAALAMADALARFARTARGRAAALGMAVAVPVRPNKIGRVEIRNPNPQKPKQFNPTTDGHG